MKIKTLFILICNLIICNLVIAQNITNTLGTLGVFKIKDGSSDYLTLNQSTGQVNILNTLRIENTTSSTVGVIFKGVDRFIHNYGAENTFIGVNSGNFTMTGFGNTTIGTQSLFSNTTGSDHTALGNYSLYSNTTGNFNTAVGYVSLYSNTIGNNNTAVGTFSLYSNITGNRNTAFGHNSLFANTNGSNNTAMGYQSLNSNSSGISNTAMGYQSLFSNTGSSNTAFGYSTGTTITSGSNLTCIGFDAEPTSGTITNQITLGNLTVTSLRCAVTTITALSDARDKKNIAELNLGINFLMKLKPRIYNWDKREWYDNNISDGSKMQETPTAGFIAQELNEVQITQNAEWLNLVLKDNPEKWEATPGNLLPIVVKAIQDLKSEKDNEIAELKTENDEIRVESEKLKVESIELKSENEEMKQRLLILEQTQSVLAGEIEKIKSNNSSINEVKLGEK